MRKPREQQIKAMMARYKVLKTTRDRPKEELQAMAEKKVDEQEAKRKEELAFKSLFSNTGDKQYAIDLHKKYLEDYSPQTISEKNTLVSLIFYEVWQKKLQENISRLMDEPKKAGNLRIPRDLYDMIDKNTQRISTLKNELGLLSKDTKSDFVQYVELLKKKAKVWQKENSAQRTRICPHCKKLINFVVKMDQYEALRHTFYKGRWLHNEKLIRLYLDGKITDEDVAEILGTSKKYTQWLIKKFYKKESMENENKAIED